MDAIEFNLEGESTKTTELILKLRKAEESTTRERQIIQDRMYEMYRRINGDKHQKQINMIQNLQNEICRLKRFHHYCYGYDRRRTQQERTSLNITEELTESIQRSRNRFHHPSKDLATERKMVKEFERLERQWKEQHEVNVVVDKGKEINEYYILGRFRRLSPLPQKPPQNLIKLWAEEIEDMGCLVLKGSRNMNKTQLTYRNLRQLIQTGTQMYEQLNIGEAEFSKHWNSRKMISIRNSIHKIEFDLVKANTYHAAGCAKSGQYSEELVKLCNRSSELHDELRMLRQNISLATFDLLKLREKKAAIRNP